MKETIAILGCGWLGYPLAKILLADGYIVKGSTTSEEKLPLLSAEGIQGYKIQLTEEKSTGEIRSFLKKATILIVCIPPGFRKAPRESFVKKIEAILPDIEKSNIEHVLYISSTSVYADTENFQEIRQKGILNTSESAKELITVENIFLENKNFSTTVSRLSGLFGADRHPIYYLAGKTGIKNAEAPINLVHQDDVIAVIRAIIEKAYWGKTLTVSHPQHPSKKKYYTETAFNLGLQIPVFEETGNSKGKIICSEKLEHDLGFTFRNSPMDWSQ